MSAASVVWVGPVESAVLVVSAASAVWAVLVGPAVSVAWVAWVDRVA